MQAHEEHPDISLAKSVPEQVVDRALDRLSDREREVTGLLLQGMKPIAIAEKLHLSPSTVSTHMTRARYKLNVQLPGQVGLLVALVGYEREEYRSLLRSIVSFMNKSPEAGSPSWESERQDIATCIERVL